LKAKTLFYNGTIHTQAGEIVVNSMAVYKNRIVAIGNNLQHDPDFKSYSRIDLRKRTIIPGLVDAHTHFYYFALTKGTVWLHDIDTIEGCQAEIKKFAARKKKTEWILGEGYSPDRFKKRIEPDRHMLDAVTGGRPAFIFSKDQHTAWVNSRALELAGITRKTKTPPGGAIERDASGEPNGILREGSAYARVFDLIPHPTHKQIDPLYREVLQFAWSQGVTGVHSFDSPEAFTYFSRLAETGKVGLRVNYYFGAAMLPELHDAKIYYGTGTEFFRVAGVKIFADGSLGSQSALCFNKYIGSKDNYGIETTSTREMTRLIKSAAKLGLPSAIHAIGDKATANVLDAFETAPRADFGARHRIEHLQLVRKKDLPRMRRLGIVASMQPSHCPSDIHMVRKYWGKRGANAYAFRSVMDRGIDLAFGSDAPIEPLKPLEGIAAAVRRARPGSRDILHPEQRLTAKEALYHYTVGPAIATGQQHCRGYLLPGYPADFILLSDDITRVPSTRIYDIGVLATIIDGKVKFADRSIDW